MPFEGRLSLAALRVLVVDDYDDSRELYSEYLRVLGYEVQSASDGDAALRCALHDRCDLIVLDLALPQLDGLTVLRLLRANSSTRHVPVIILSASVGRQIQEDAIAAGASVFLSKPCLPEDLDKAIRDVLDAGLSVEADPRDSREG
jgi:two-component system, cell cycle response regulator DivK